MKFSSFASMFFLGASAQLFIYLLVPAFLIVCFYFSGIQGNPEIVSTFPEAVMYEYTAGHSQITSAYFYEVKMQEAAARKPQPARQPFLMQRQAVMLWLPVYYSTPVLASSLLRAPPAFRF